MAEGSSSYDKIDHTTDRFGGCEALGTREADPKRSEDKEPQSDFEENDHRRFPIRTNGRSTKPDDRRDLSIKTPESISQPKLSTNNIPSRTGDGPQNGDTDKSSKNHPAAEPQGHPLSSTSGSATPSSIDGSSRIESPISPVSPTETSKPTVRFSDRGLPRAFAKRPPVSRRSSANAMPVAEWGVLFDERDYATPRCSQFLKGLARHVIDDLAPGSSNLVITPEKLSVFYSKYRVDQEIYTFVDIFNSRSRDVYERIADFFTDLDCQYHLVQLDSYSRPRVPALTPVGFAQYLTTCILAYPDEEFRRLGKVVADVQLVAESPNGGSGDSQLERLPRQLLRSQFPVHHDPKSRKILEAALDDLMYDLGLLGPARPKAPAPLAIMPPPPPSSSERWGSTAGGGSGIRYYAPTEQTSARKDAYSSPTAETSKARGRYVPTGALQTIGDDETAAPTQPAAETPDYQTQNQNKYRDPSRRNSYHERPLSRYADDLEVSGHDHAPPARVRQPPPQPQRQNSFDLRPLTRFSSPRTSQAGSLTITPTTTTRTYRTTTAYTPKQSGGTPVVGGTGTGTSTGGSNTPTYRRAQSPPLRTYRASAPDVSGGCSGGSGSVSGSSGFKPAGYLPSSADRRASTSTAADRREYAASLVSGSADSYVCSRNEGAGAGGSRENERNEITRKGSASMAVSSSSSGGGGGGKAATPVMTPSSTSTALVPLSSAAGSSHQHHSRQDSTGTRRTATAPPSPAPGSGEKKLHSHRRRRSAVVTIDDDRGPTWEEVLKAQPPAPQHHRSGSSSKGAAGGHHHRHHSGY
ncbi:uncharacterized protein F4807DRAFT_467192 [Annulohypoxylon truncatum]|uniref:uncharacterized protein n=1 Tax=Annulohypoxylon truncatum TaxID=327061 RepID=UPI002007BA07|nr:uncharacterized protein F4807DRAFT_467192 [Annulohypoxylon truncatum]KAI1210456.1 hypothetical protein F4807DRAFT_467192 [Annulohypoxylon truncatum]